MEELTIISDFFKALSNNYRLLLILVLKEGELNVGELQKYIDIKPALLSKHLKLLMKYDIVRQRRSGRERFYYLANNCFLKNIIKEIMAEMAKD